MSNKKHIDDTIYTIKNEWKKHSNLRFLQFITNSVGNNKKNLFYVTDEELIQYIADNQNESLPHDTQKTWEISESELVETTESFMKEIDDLISKINQYWYNGENYEQSAHIVKQIMSNHWNRIYAYHRLQTRKPHLLIGSLLRECDEGFSNTKLCPKCHSSLKHKFDFTLLGFHLHIGKALGCIQPTCKNYYKNNSHNER